MKASLGQRLREPSPHINYPHELFGSYGPNCYHSIKQTATHMELLGASPANIGKGLKKGQFDDPVMGCLYLETSPHCAAQREFLELEHPTYMYRSYFFPNNSTNRTIIHELSIMRDQLAHKNHLSGSRSHQGGDFISEHV